MYVWDCTLSRGLPARVHRRNGAGETVRKALTMEGALGEKTGVRGGTFLDERTTYLYKMEFLCFKLINTKNNIEFVWEVLAPKNVLP